MPSFRNIALLHFLQRFMLVAEGQQFLLVFLTQNKMPGNNNPHSIQYNQNEVITFLWQSQFWGKYCQLLILAFLTQNGRNVKKTNTPISTHSERICLSSQFCTRTPKPIWKQLNDVFQTYIKCYISKCQIILMGSTSGLLFFTDWLARWSN